jgi:hypothetical protein
MTDKIHGFLPTTYVPPTDRQRLLMRYLFGVLIDLVVLNLFNEFWERVTVASFSLSLLAAIVMQLLLKLTIYLEHRVAVYFDAKPGPLMRMLRFLGAWAVLFGSKFVILEVLSTLFGDKVKFDGPMHGAGTLIIVVIAMIVAEEAIVRLVRWAR